MVVVSVRPSAHLPWHEDASSGDKFGHDGRGDFSGGIIHTMAISSSDASCVDKSGHGGTGGFSRGTVHVQAC